DKTLADADPSVRVGAAEALWEILGDQAKGIVPVLVGGVQVKSRPEVRARAAGVLGTMRSADPKALDALETALSDAEASVRIEAAFALGSIGAPRSMPKFLTALGDPEIKVRIVCAQALWLVAKETKGVPILMDALRHQDPEV